MTNVPKTKEEKKVAFYKRLNTKDGFVHPTLGQCWQLMAVRGKDKGKIGWSRCSRTAWEVIRGEIPEGLQVLHKCDNPACIRPSHLFLGTISDNVRDAVAKGRKPGFANNQHALGHKQPESAKKTKSIKAKASWVRRRAVGKDGTTKLSNEQIESIKREYKRTSYLVSNSKELAEKYGVGQTYIARIISGDRRKCQ